MRRLYSGFLRDWRSEYCLGCDSAVASCQKRSQAAAATVLQAGSLGHVCPWFLVSPGFDYLIVLHIIGPIMLI
jgi:hypothetical protein